MESRVGKPRNLTRKFSQDYVWTFHQVSGGVEKIMQPALKVLMTGVFGTSRSLLPWCWPREIHTLFRDVASSRHVNVGADDEQWSRKGEARATYQHQHRAG